MPSIAQGMISPAPPPSGGKSGELWIESGHAVVETGLWQQLSCGWRGVQVCGGGLYVPTTKIGVGGS